MFSIAVIDDNVSAKKMPLTKNTKKKSFSGHDEGHVIHSSKFKPVILSTASCSPMSSSGHCSHQHFNEE